MWFSRNSEFYLRLLLLSWAGSVVAVSQDDLNYGVKIFFQAYDATGAFEGKNDPMIDYYYRAMSSNSDSIQEQLKPHPVEAQMKWFQSWFFDTEGPFAYHPKDYKNECSKFAQTPLATATVDESEALNDKEKQYPFRALSHCLINLVGKRGGNKKIQTGNAVGPTETNEIGLSQEDLDYGVKMFFRACEATCWYESAIGYPIPYDNQIYGRYTQLLAFYKNTSLEYIKTKSPKEKVEWYYYWFFHEHGPLAKHPNEYKKECSEFAKDAFAKPNVDEGQTLEDEGKEYPFRALSYCLMNQMRRRGGDKIIETWKNDRLHSKKNWRQAVLERHNLLRAAHGASPVTMTDFYNKGAQEWSDKLAQECQIYHSPPSVRYPDPSDPLGENIGAQEMMHDAYIEALLSTNAFYREVKDYCYPDDFIEGGNHQSNPPGCELSGPRQTGHFTQLVWKTTEKVGFGHACNPKCGRMGMCFMTARYSGPGNWMGKPGAFRDNVQKPTY